MIHDKIDFHGFAELRESPDHAGLRLQRVPESVRERLEEPARRRTLAAGASELRFVLEEEEATVRLSAAEGETSALVFFGPFNGKMPTPIGREPVDIVIGPQERLAAFPAEMAARQPFSPKVVRIRPHYGAQILYHGVEGAVRPPKPEETPSRTMLSYGTSITHGGAATHTHLNYVSQAAWRLGTDLLNFGVGGACRCEATFADYLASLEGWDFATLCLSVNMLGAGFTAEEFGHRTRYLIERLATAEPKRPIFPFTILPFFGDFGVLQPAAKSTAAEFRKTLREEVADLDLDNVHLLEGPDLLPDLGGLTSDMIHPSDLGMIQIGENLAARVRAVLDAS